MANVGAIVGEEGGGEVGGTVVVEEGPQPERKIEVMETRKKALSLVTDKLS